MKTIFRIPLWALFVMLALSLLIEAPVIVFPFYAGSSYHRIDISPIGNDELYYLSRAKSVLDGHSLGQPFIAGNDGAQDSFFSDVEYAYMVPLRALGLGPSIDVPALYNTLNFAGIFAMLILIYLLVFFLSGDVFIATAAAIFSLGGYLWVEYGTVLRLIVLGQPIFAPIFNIFERSTDPYTALLPFFAFLICTYKAVMNEAPAARGWWKYRYAIAAGLLFGLLFYDYFYAWTFALAFLGSLTITSLLFRKQKAALTSISIAAVGIVIGSYQVWSMYKLFSSPMGAQISYILMSAHSHGLIKSATGLAAFIVFCIYWYFQRHDKNNFFILALIAAGWVALEQQAITGRMVQYGHYYWYFVVPLSIIVVIYMLARLIAMRSKQIAHWTCLALIVGALVCTAGDQYKAFLVSVPDSLRQQDFMPIMRALNDLPDGVVLGDPGGQSSSILLTIYTRDTNYFSYAGIVNVFPIERMKDALFVYLYLNKDARTDPEIYLRTALSTSTSTNYTDMYETLEGYYNGIPLSMYRTASPHTDPQILAARATFLPQIEKEYRSVAASPSKVRDALQAAGVRYVLWDQRLYPEWDPSVLGPLTVIATSSDITLFGIATNR